MAISLTAVLIASFVLLAIYKSVRWMFERPPNFPPGPPRLPLVGSYLFLLLVNYRHIALALTRLAKWYGTDVLGFYYGATRCVTMHGMDVSREALLNPDLDGRAVFELVRARDPNWGAYGIFFTDGPYWREQRRFTLRHMRDYGFGRRFAELETYIREDLEDFVELLRHGPRHEHERRLMPTSGFFRNGSGNGSGSCASDGVLQLPLAFTALPGNWLMWCVLNERTAPKDFAGLYENGEHAMMFQRESCAFGRFFSLIPSWRYFFPGGCGYTKLRTSSMGMHGFMARVLAREWASYDGEHERHFLDRYFREMHKGEVDSTFQSKCGWR